MDHIFKFLDANNIMSFLYSLSVIATLTALGFVLARRIIPPVAYRFIGSVKPQWLGAFQTHNTFKHLTYIAPIVFMYFGFNSLEIYFEGEFITDIVKIINNVLICWVIFHLMFFADALSDTILDIYHQYPISKIRSIKGFVQVAMLIIYVVGGSSIIIVLLNRNPSTLVTTVGGGSIILGLIFRETIMSFTAGIQITSNRLVQRGDWIEVPKYGANGIVTEVALHVVTVQNFDKTIVTLPTYKLVEEGFRNWRGMVEAGGRRIMRSIPIDQSTIRFLDVNELENIKNNKIVQDVMSDFQLEPDMTYTNLGLFRGYAEAYLHKHPKIRNDMTFLVRLLEPTQSGVPLQLSIFVNEINWMHYEKIQAGIFEHLIAIIPLFKLRVFQSPTGTDFDRISKVI